MRRSLLALSSLFLWTAMAFAQGPMWTPPTLPAPLPGFDAGAPDAGPLSPLSTWLGGGRREPSVWASGEFLMWWTKGAPVNTPLLTAALNPADPTAGRIGSANTAVLLGNQSYDIGDPRYGGRFTIGRWLDSDNTIGIEASYFFIAPRSSTTAFGSNGAPGSPLLGIPYFDVTTGREAAFAPFTGNFPNFIGAGGAALTLQNQLQGGEINFVGRLARNQNFSLDGIAGLRYINFTENLDYTTGNVTPLNAGSYTTLDSLRATNNFYGGQLGLRGEYRIGNFFIEATAKAALGDMNQVVNVGGVSNSVIAGAGPTFNYTGAPGGFFAQPTNIGQHNRDAFAVVPEGELKVGYNIRQNIQLFAAYNFLYLSDVARPGAVLDHAQNPTQNATISGFPNTLVGAPAPSFSFSRSDFWAQGVSFGVLFKF